LVLHSTINDRGRMNMGGLLQSVRVLDLSRVLAGPYCAMLLGDLGAEVIKLERPGAGDDTRHWGPPFVGGESAYYLCCNRNKKSITLDLKSPAGRDLALRLAAESDVVLENFVPGTLERLGLGYDQLRSANSGIVLCSITGFGQTGPYRDLPGYDIIVQGMAGIMSITGEPGGPPMKVGVAISDITAGLFACNAILAALVARQQTGRGDWIDISLLDSSVAWLANVGSNYLATGEVPARYGNAHANIVPYQAFQAADRYLIVAVGNDAQWQRFCQAISRPDLAAEERFRTNPLRVENRAALLPLLEAVFLERSAEEWLRRLNAADVPCGPVNTLDRVFSDPQVQSRHMLLEVPHPTAGSVKMTASPWKLASAAPSQHRPPPLLGQHTDEILRDLLGLGPGQIAELRAQQVV
jgi:formyl-CoA transferase